MITSQLKMEKQEQVSLNFCISGKGNSKAFLIFIISMFRSTCTEYRIYGGYFSKALGPMLSKVPSSLNYSVIRVPGPGYLSSLLYSEEWHCAHHLKLLPVSLFFAITCAAKASGCGHLLSRKVKSWQEVSVDISQDKAKLFFIAWSPSLSWNRRYSYTQQLPWPHIPWDQINLSWFGPSLWYLVYPLSQILSQWMGGSSSLQKVIPSIWGCACKIDSTDIQKHLCLSVACSWQFGLKAPFMSGYS